MDLIWGPMLGTLSKLFDEYHDPRTVSAILQGYTACCCIAAHVSAAQGRASDCKRQWRRRPTEDMWTVQ